MARLRCETRAERLLLPAFVFFFNLLYPMPWANSGRRVAAAGGCILVRRDALETAGGFRAIRDAVIDDIALARRVRGPIRLALADREVVSLREHPSVNSIWRVVARTAFVELHRSWTRLGFVVALLVGLFPLPPALVAVGVGLALSGHVATGLAVGAPGLAAFALQARLFLPTVGYVGQSRLRALTLPVVGTLYGAMTVDSALGRTRETELGRRYP
jgi:Glycosyl transferase family 21